MNEWETKKQISLRRSGTRGKVKGKRKVSKVKRDMKISMTKKRELRLESLDYMDYYLH